MLFAFYTFSMEVEAGSLIYGFCCVLSMRIQCIGMWGSGKLDTVNIRDGFWKIQHWMYNLGSSFVSPGVVHLKFLFQSLKANKCAEKCRISDCLFKKEKKNVKGIAKIFTFITKQAIFRFQTKPLLFFPHSRYHYGRQLQHSWEEPKYTEYLKYIFLLLTFWLFTSWTLC